MTAKHTPSPYWLKQFDDQQYLIMAGDPDNKMTWRTIATIIIGGEQSQANADLLVAAPEMLEGCELAVYRLCIGDGDIQARINEVLPKLRAIIRKARGE